MTLDTPILQTITHNSSKAPKSMPSLRTLSQMCFTLEALNSKRCTFLRYTFSNAFRFRSAKPPKSKSSLGIFSQMCFALEAKSAKGSALLGTLSTSTKIVRGIERLAYVYCITP